MPKKTPAKPAKPAKKPSNNSSPMMTPASQQPSSKKTTAKEAQPAAPALMKTVKKIAKKAVDATVGNAKIADLDPFRLNPEGEIMTSDQGIKINHTDDSLKAGPRGPTLIEDFHFREKITRFDHERIPERVVHARGSAAHGVFETYDSMSEFTKAGFLQKPGTKTPVFVRFSTVLGSRGSADTVRDVRGFAVKFYTDEGNFDLVGNNIPVFFVQDGIKFPDLVHAAKPEPHHEIPGASTAHDTFWDFVSLTPESTHMLMWMLSDRTIPRSYANMEGFGVHTFRFVNEKGKSRFVKFHWKPVLGLASFVWDEAQKIAGKDPDFHRRQLWESIELGQGPEFELGVQIIEEKDAEKFDFDLLDPTKIVPEELVPVRIMGKLTLDRNPDNFFAETEQVAFHVANLVPGIDVTNDPLMQARLFSYLDTQLTRLGGPNFAEIPINRPIPPVHNHQQDGFHRTTITQGRANYFPNSIGGGCPFMAKAQQGGYTHFPEAVEGVKTRARSASFSDHFSQATLFFESLSEVEKRHLIDAACFELGKVEIEEIRERVIANFTQVNAEMASEIAMKIGVNAPKVQKAKTKGKIVSSPALSQERQKKPTLQSRMVGVLISDGFSMADLTVLKQQLEENGGRIEVIGSRLGTFKSKEGKALKADKSFLTGASVFYDGVFLPSGTAALSESADALYFVQEAYQHCKPIGALGDGSRVLSEAGILAPSIDKKGDQDDRRTGIETGNKGSSVIGAFLESLSAHRHWGRPEKLNPGHSIRR